MTKKISVYIGRFQPFHNGHKEILSSALKESDLVIVLIGSAYQARTVKNPFMHEERAHLIKSYARNFAPAVDTGLVIDYIQDQPYNDAKWIQSVQEAVAECVFDNFKQSTPVEITLVGSDRDKSCWYLHAFPQWKLSLKPAVPIGQDLSATKIRDTLFSMKSNIISTVADSVPVTTLGFLKQFIQSHEFRVLLDEYNFIQDYKKAWAAAPYEPTFQTADGVVIQSGHVLVTIRGHLPGKGLWALPGGFVKKSQTIKQAAIAEIIEETGIRLAEGKKSREITASILEGSIRSQANFDSPDRSLRGRTFTTAFLFRLSDTKPLPKVAGQFAPLEDTGGVPGVVETLEAMWVPIHIARSTPQLWFEDHHAILDWAIGQIRD